MKQIKILETFSLTRMILSIQLEFQKSSKIFLQHRLLSLQRAKLNQEIIFLTKLAQTILTLTTLQVEMELQERDHSLNSHNRC